MSPLRDFFDSDEKKASLVNLLAAFLIVVGVLGGFVAILLDKFSTEVGVFVGGLITAGSGLLVKKFLDKATP